MKRWLVGILCMSCCIVSQAALTPITVALDWYINPDHAALLVAQQKGYFQQQGLAVTFIAPTETAEPEQLVASGQAQVAVSYQPYLLMDVAAGMPLLRFASLVNQPLDCIAVLASSSIHSVADLNDKTLGYSGGDGVEQDVLSVILAHNGLTVQDLKLVNVKMNLVQALLSQRVDAVKGLMRNVEPIELRDLGHPARLFFPEDNGIPSYDELILVANASQAHAAWIVKFVTALQQATDYIHAYPEASWQLVKHAYPAALAPSVALTKTNHDIWNATLPYLAAHPGTLDQARYQKFEQFFVQQHLLSQPLPLSRYALEVPVEQ